MAMTVKEIDAILFGWGEWHIKRAELSGYSSTTITGLLVSGLVGLGKHLARSVIPFGVRFEMDNRAEMYRLIDEFVATLPDVQQAVLMHYYMYATDTNLTCSQRTMQRTRNAIRDKCSEYISSHVLFA